MLICPVCKHPLIKIEKRFACLNNHSFDMAKQGYINLLLCDMKKTLNPGDNKEMVKSRLGFLNNKHYFPVADALNRFIEKNLLTSISQTIQIADIGVGVLGVAAGLSAASALLNALLNNLSLKYPNSAVQVYNEADQYNLSSFQQNSALSALAFGVSIGAALIYGSSGKKITVDDLRHAPEYTASWISRKLFNKQSTSDENLIQEKRSRSPRRYK